ncbi:MAG TPA: DUF3108 domain-containing protein [Thermoanaerobaculia bacterium]|nr:DUF3108 domain-containing protein [Thermoanaerobaculia bacterium]
MKVIRNVLLVAALVVPVAASAAELNCSGPANVEEFHYKWHLRGGIGWIAGFLFPRSGSGFLKTTYPNSEKSTISSELMVTGNNGTSGFYNYQSEIDGSGKTLSTYHGYAWGKKSRKERTVFDYVKRLARMHKETTTATEDTVRLLPKDEPEFRDILTAIHYMRTNADQITAPITTMIYMDGKEYPVIFKPAGRQVFTIHDQRVNAIGFDIVDAPGAVKKWSGGLQVWLSDDTRRIPFRITITESLASMQLDLDTINACGFLNAASGIRHP